jgi:Gpi18-like mannosyltransferase/4-amino-4-deoxy-L-arabinose transferase-like glycosyltransferase
MLSPRARRGSADGHALMGVENSRAIRARSFVRQKLPVVVLALAGLAATTPQADGGPSGKLVGLFSAVVLAAIVALTFAREIEPARGEPDSRIETVLVVLVVLAVVKLFLLPFFPGFGPDVGSYQAWALQISNLGPAHTYQTGYFLDYPPGYLYALWVAGIGAQMVHASGDFLRVIVEGPAIVADLFLALTVWAFVRRTREPSIALVAMLLIALNPAMLFDTVVWGQSDSVLTFTMWLSVLALLADQYDLCWAMAAISVLVKPQGMMLLPVLAWWTMLKTPVSRWVRCGVVGIAVFAIGIIPFQIGHPWNWILNLYTSTAAYYHETSVNAFNLIALLGGLRRPDSDTFGGISFFAFGMSLLAPLYAFVAWVLWRERSPRTLVYAAFITIFGFFMLAPRMHERYLYPALAFAVPLALESTEMMLVFAALTLTCLFNLAYVLHALETVVFLDRRDWLAMTTSALNVVIFGYSIHYGATQLGSVPDERHPSLAGQALSGLYARLFPERSPEQAAEPRIAPLQWSRLDTAIISALLAAAAATRFWHLGHPNAIVFDEVHFVAEQARHYLHGEVFLDPHPPLAKLIIALGILIFGDHAWAWRVGNAILGTALVGVTYLLGRRMMRARMAGALAAGAILLDGMFLVDSRIAVIDIVYLTFAAISYALLFRLIDSKDLLSRRRVMPWMGLALGLCVGSKLYIPAVTFLLVVGFMIYVLARDLRSDRWRDRRIIAAVALVGGVASIAYISVFLPKYYLGWWGGIADLFNYYKEVIWYEKSVSSATHPYASPWWSWPLMLRPIAYWQDFPKSGNVATVWGGGNPALWWAGLTAITITAVQAFERPSLERSFLVIGYLGYLVIWVPIGRTLFLYHYMGSIFLAYVALGALLTQFWDGGAEPWEHLALLLTMMPVYVLGLGSLWGALIFAALVGAYFAALFWTRYAGRLICVAFAATAVATFIYFFPVWTAIPIARSSYYARMWLQGPGLRNWI